MLHRCNDNIAGRLSVCLRERLYGLYEIVGESKRAFI